MVFHIKKNTDEKKLGDDVKKGRRFGPVYIDREHNVISFKEKTWRFEFTKSDIRRFAGKGAYRVGIAGILIASIVAMTVSLPGEAKIAHFYAGTCLGGWESPRNAQDVPEAKSRSANSFDSTNSALGRVGGSSMFCGNFQGNIPRKKVMSEARLSFSLYVGEEEVDNNAVVHAKALSDEGGTKSTVNDDGSVTIEGSDIRDSAQDIIDAPEGASVDFTVTPEGSDGEEKTVSDEPPVTTIEGSDIRDSAQDIIDAPSGDVVEYHLSEETVEETVPEPEEASDSIEPTVSETEVPEPEPTDPDPVDEPVSAEESVSFFETMFKAFSIVRASVVYAQIPSEEEVVSETPVLPDAQATTPDEDLSPVSEEIITPEDPIVAEETDEIPAEDTQTAEEIEDVDSVPEDISAESSDIPTQTSQEQEALQPTVLEAPEDQLFSIEYTMNGVDWEPVGYVTSGNWQDISFKLPVVSWDELSHVQVRLVSAETLDETIFVDSVVISVEHHDGKIARTRPESTKKSFRVGDDLKFEFEYAARKGGFGKKLLNEVVSVFKANKAPTFRSAKVSNIRGEVFEDMLASTADLENGMWEVSLDTKKRVLKPGKYTITVEVEDDGEVVTEQQDFYWGVLAININKSILEPNETGYLQMGALNDVGHTLCDAPLELVVQDPLGEETIYATDDGSIRKSGFCEGDSFVNVPDYSAYYTVSVPGTYTMLFTNLDNGYEMEDFFEVRENVPFVVERKAPTRIYPPATYETIITLEARQDFKGDVYEYVPLSFAISNATQTLEAMPSVAEGGNIEFQGSSVEYAGSSVADEADTQKMLWFVDMQAGDKITLSYTFDAPDVSPEFYLLGPLEFYE